MSDSARGEPIVMRALLCAALTIFCAHTLYATGWLDGSHLGWLFESPVHTGLLAGALVLMYFRNRSLRASGRSEARTDPLTGLANRRQLMEDLARIEEAESDPRIFALFDLDGFKSYNDSFGHPAGDALLVELAESLQAAIRPPGAPTVWAVTSSASSRPAQLMPASRSQRLLRLSLPTARGSRSQARAASSSCPRRRRHGRRLASRRPPHVLGKEPAAPLGRASNARHAAAGPARAGAELDRHLRSVAALALELGQAIHLDAEQLDEVARAAELHDIGKIAVPDAIMQKRTPLNSAEWALMRNHPVIGERILSSAPAMAPVAKLVRSTHERWDGQRVPGRARGRADPVRLPPDRGV